ncbi:MULTISPECIES: DUF2612 domain-containing protein [unclassified Rhizobium]|uniref:DUF2612 domain-containing protein n=1 Tax=unclassified Rhizobium TaxID=2613769 RepID=UPI0037F111E8
MAEDDGIGFFAIGISSIGTTPAVESYLDRVAPFWRGKQKFMAELAALFEPITDLQDVLAGLPGDFDLDVAVGVQLDAVGEWVGRSRNIPIPIANVWFSFDDAPRGFDLGIWKGPFDNDYGITVLDDDTYRLFLRAKIAANNWDGTVETATAAFNLIFSKSPGSLIFVIDNGDMSMTVGIAGKIPSILFLALLKQGFLPLKPEGVRVDYEITSVDGQPVFGFDVENEYIAGFDTGAWGVTPDYFTS